MSDAPSPLVFRERGREKKKKKNTPAKSYTPSEIIQGPGDLWFIGTAPTDVAVRLTLASDGTPDATAHPGVGVLGASLTAITTSVKPKISEITTDQYDAPIDSYAVELEAKIEAEMQQVESALLQRAIGVGTYAAGAGYEQTTFGGTFVVPTGCFAVISPSRLNAQQYVVSVLYVGAMTGGFSFPMGRAKSAAYKTAITALSDPARAVASRSGWSTRRW